MKPWTLIVYEVRSRGAAVNAFVPQMTRFSRCRMTGYIDGNPVRFISRTAFRHQARNAPLLKVICHGFEPSDVELELIEALTLN